MEFRLYDMPLPSRKCVEIHTPKGEKLIIPQIEKWKAYCLEQIPLTETFVNRVLGLLNASTDLKDKITSKDHALNRLIVTINKLRDTVSRRNMQTKALKEKIKTLNKYVCKTCSKPMTNVTCMNCPYWSINA